MKFESLEFILKKYLCLFRIEIFKKNYFLFKKIIIYVLSFFKVLLTNSLFMKPTEPDEAKSGCFRSLTKCFKLRNSVGVNDHDIEDLNSPIVNVSSDENCDEKTKSSSENKHEIGNLSLFF
jgi:hypothetical protein